MRFDNPSSPVNRSCAALGIIDSNEIWASGDGNILLTSGTVRYTYIPLLAGDVVSAVHFWVNVVAATVTTIKGGLYSYSGGTGTLLAASANDTSAFSALGMATLPMTTPYVVPTTGNYLIAVLSVATTPGTLMTCGTTSGVTGKQNGAIIVGAYEASQTDLDATSSLALLTSIPLWAGWS